MKIDITYINQLISKSKNHLKRNYNILNIKFDNFELINAFLIDKAINQSDYNLFIQIPKRDTKRDLYLPIIISAAASLFFKNYIDDKTDYKVGDILQRDGERYELVDIQADEYILLKRDNYDTKRIVNKKQIKKFILTTANLSNRRVKTKFNHYKNLFNLLFNVDDFPSKFSYKTAIIIEKKDFIETIKNKKIGNIELSKAIPIKWVTKKGLINNQSDYIPIEPMIYLVPDYETFKEHLINKIENLDSVIFVGETKYDPHLLQIKKDLRTGIIPNAIFIGRKKIDELSKLKTWNWTFPEINYFDNKEFGEFNIIETGNNDFIEKIANLEKITSEIDEEYFFNLKSRVLYKSKRHFYSLILTNEKSRLSTQIEPLKYAIKEKFETALKDLFYSINEDPYPFIKKITPLIDEIFASLKNYKFQILLKQSNIDILIIQDRFKEIITEEFQQISNLETFKIFTVNEFLKKEKGYTNKKNVYLLSVFGYKIKPYELLKKLLSTLHNIYFILYPEEKDILARLKNRYENELIKEYNSPDRLFLSGVEYPIKQKEEDISEIIDKFYSKEELENKKYNYEPIEAIEYQIEFDNGEIEILEGSRTVLLESNSFKRKEKVSNLMSGDKIRVYENTSKERLFEIASKEDTEGRLKEVIKYSKLWKEILIDYFNKRVKENPYYNEENLLKELQQNGSKIKISTLRKWLQLDDKDLFPAQLINLIAIKRTVKSDKLDKEFDHIKKSKSFYRSIMIALGRDLSDEIMDYILSNNKVKGKILEKFSENQIKSFIKASAPLRRIKNISIKDTEMNDE